MALKTLCINQYTIKDLKADGGHIYLQAVIPELGQADIFFRNRLEEKKIFDRAEITLKGNWVAADGGNHLLNAQILKVKLLLEISLDDLSIKDRLNASGLIHEFRQVFRKDKIRAMEILKVLGVSEKFSEEILLRNSYILPFL